MSNSINRELNIWCPVSFNNRLALRRLFTACGFRKTPVGASAFVAFCSTTFCQPWSRIKIRCFASLYPGWQNVANLDKMKKVYYIGLDVHKDKTQMAVLEMRGKEPVAVKVRTLYAIFANVEKISLQNFKGIII